jgi:GNAT superfamily N-acetyltransferase
MITAAHGTLYAAEFGWDVTFEAYVARHLADFATRAPAPRERIWIAEDQEGFAGCVAIVESSAATAQLRWFLVHPEARRTGLGRRLLGDAMTFARDAGYSTIVLDTVSELTDAARLYRAAGFVLTSEQEEPGWGRPVLAQRFSYGPAFDASE